MCGVADEGAGGLVVAFALCGESFMEDGHRKEEEDAVSMTMEEIIRDLPYARGRRHLLILSGEVFDSGKNLFASGPNWSNAGAFGMYLWTGRTLSVKRGRVRN